MPPDAHERNVVPGTAGFQPALSDSALSPRRKCRQGCLRSQEPRSACAHLVTPSARAEPKRVTGTYLHVKERARALGGLFRFIHLAINLRFCQYRPAASPCRLPVSWSFRRLPGVVRAVRGIGTALRSSYCCCCQIDEVTEPGMKSPSLPACATSFWNWTSFCSLVRA